MNAWAAVTETVQVLGWTLLHFVWQAALVGAVFASLRRWLPRGNARYLLGMLALAALALCPVLTAWYLARAIPAGGDTGFAAVAAVYPGAGAQAGTVAARGWQGVLSAALPWLVLAWSCGVALLSLRVWRHWRKLRAMVRAAHVVPAWQERLRSLARVFGLHRGIRVLSSARVATPTLVGWFRPAILLPLAVSSGFPVEQVELILAHELAHLRRLDHFANLFQVALETLLFYHPVVHWISRDVRNERELCCDALALRVTGGNRREFANALVELEEFRERHAGLALAASGGVLLERIGQITGTDRTRAARQPGRFVGACSALLLAALLLSLLWRQAELRHSSPGSAADLRSVLVSPLLPASIRMPIQAIANLTPRHIAISPALLAPVRTPAVAQTPQEIAPGGKLALAAPAIADLNPARLELAPVAAPAPAAPVQDRPEALAPVRMEQPVYPSGALEQGVEGRVVLEFAVNTDGSVRDPQVVDAQPAGIFDRSATRALLGWRFAPPADTQRRYRQTFTFTLHADRDAAGREVQAKAGCYAVTGTHICRAHGADEAFLGGGFR